MTDDERKQFHIDKERQRMEGLNDLTGEERARLRRMDQLEREAVHLRAECDRLRVEAAHTTNYYASLYRGAHAQCVANHKGMRRLTRKIKRLQASGHHVGGTDWFAKSKELDGLVYELRRKLSNAEGEASIVKRRMQDLDDVFVPLADRFLTHLSALPTIHMDVVSAIEAAINERARILGIVVGEPKGAE